MANKRILPAAQAIFVGPSPATGQQYFSQASGVQLHRCQSYSFEWSKSLSPVQQLGQLSAIVYDSIDPVAVNFSADWLATNVRNESGIGLFICNGTQVSGALARILDGSASTKNYYVKVVPDGQVALGNSIDSNVYAFGNMNLASYGVQGSVGNYPTASMTSQGLNIRWTASSVNFDTPSINPQDGTPITGVFVTLPTPTSGTASQLAVLKPGEISIDLNGAGFGIPLTNLCVNSYDISTDLSLSPLICLGSRFPTEYLIEFPVTAQASFEVNVRDIGTGALSSLVCNSPVYNLAVTLRAPTCDGTLGATKIKYFLQGASLESQSWSTDVGTNSQTTTLSFSCPLGSSTETNGFYISGSID